MPIFSQGYQEWRGKLHGRPWRILAVAGLEMHLQVRRVMPWVSYGLILIVTAFATMIVYMSLNGFPGSGGGMLPPFMATQVVKSYLGGINLSFLSSIFVALIGSGAIARDRRFNAHLLYFSKAITPADYLAGKTIALGILVFLTGLAPAVLYCAAAYPAAAQVLSRPALLGLFFGCAVQSLLVTLHYVGLVLAFSSLTKNRYLPGIVFYATLFVFWVFGSLYNFVGLAQAGFDSNEMMKESHAEIRDGKPVAVIVGKYGSKSVTKEITCGVPEGFDSETWLATRPSEWHWFGGFEPPQGSESVGPDGVPRPKHVVWGKMEVETIESEWTATPYEWLVALNQWRLLGRTADPFYPNPTPSKMTLGEAVLFGGDPEPDIAQPWWQVALVCLVVTLCPYGFVLWRLRSFERREG